MGPRIVSRQSYAGIFLKLCAVYGERRDTMSVVNRKNAAQSRIPTDTARRDARKINHSVS